MHHNCFKFPSEFFALHYLFRLFLVVPQALKEMYLPEKIRITKLHLNT